MDNIFRFVMVREPDAVLSAVVPNLFPYGEGSFVSGLRALQIEAGKQRHPATWLAREASLVVEGYLAEVDPNGLLEQTPPELAVAERVDTVSDPKATIIFVQKLGNTILAMFLGGRHRGPYPALCRVLRTACVARLLGAGRSLSKAELEVFMRAPIRLPEGLLPLRADGVPTPPASETDNADRVSSTAYAPLAAARREALDLLAARRFDVRQLSEAATTVLTRAGFSLDTDLIALTQQVERRVATLAQREFATRRLQQLHRS